MRCLKITKQLIESPKSLVMISFAWSRAIVCILLTIAGYFQYREYGAAFNHENGLGNWLFLGGPTLFYPTGAIGWIFAGFLGLYVIGSIARITFTIETNLKESTLLVKEWRFGLTRITRISLKNILQLRLSNRSIGWYWIWILAFGFHILYLFTDVWYFTTNPFTFGRGFETAYFYLLQIGVELICLIILLYWQAFQLRITIKEGFYLLHWMPLKSFSAFQIQFQTIFHGMINRCVQENNAHGFLNLEKGIEFSQVLLSTANKTYRWRMFVLGITWVLIGLICRFGRFGFGEFLQYALVICGSVLCYIQIIALKTTIYEYNSRIESDHPRNWEKLIIFPLILLLSIDLGIIGWAIIHDWSFRLTFSVHMGFTLLILGGWIWFKHICNSPPN